MAAVVLMLAVDCFAASVSLQYMYQVESTFPVLNDQTMSVHATFGCDWC